MNAPIRHYHMYGELNVTLKIDKEEKYLYLPCFTSLKELSKRFLQVIHYDYRCFDFSSNKKMITDQNILYYTVDNPLKDFVINCKPKTKGIELQDVDICLNIKEEKRKLTFKTIKDFINEKDLAILVSQYFSLMPEDLTIKKVKQNKYSIDSNHLILLKATIQDNDEPVELIFSDKSSVLDLKYLASVFDPKNCSRLYISDRDKDSLNRFIVSKKFKNGQKKLLFRPYNNIIYYKENDFAEVKQTTFDGAPIGRNIIRAIAKEMKMSLNKANHKILMQTESETGIHTSKVKCAKFVKLLNSPFILLDEVPYKFEIHRGAESIAQEIYIDPQFQIWQLRNYLSNLPNFAPSYFIKIKNQKGQIDDKLKVEEAYKASPKFIVEVEEPHPVEATFKLYNSENKKQTLSIDPSESTLSVIKVFCENFKISPSFIHIFMNGLRAIDNHKFINYYFDGTIYNVASELYIELNYKDSQKNLVFPLNIEFELLVTVCKQKFGLSDKVKIGFIDISSDDDSEHILVYSAWEKKHIFPGPQYVARYQKIKEMKAKFLVVSKETYDKKFAKKPSSSTKEIELDVLIYTQDGRLESKLTEKLSEKVQNVAAKILTDESQNLDSSLFFVSEHELRPDSTIYDVQQIFKKVKDESSARPKLTVFGLSNMYLYKLPGSSDFKFILADPSMSLYDLKNQIRKSSQMIIIKYDGDSVSNLAQPIVFFNQRKPFFIEYVKNLKYNLIYNDSKEIHKKELIFDENSTIFNVMKESCDFLNSIENKSSGSPKSTEKPSSRPPKGSEKPGYKLTQIRVMINSVILTKEMEKDLLVNDFGLSGDVIITPLQKIGITIQGENLHFFYFSKNDTVMFVKKTILRRLDAKEEDAPYYFLLNNQVAVNDSDLMSEFFDDDDICLDIVPIQNTAKVSLIFPEFTHEFVFSNEIIMYDIKEHFAQYYKIEDPDLLELIDQATGEPVDDNDCPTDDQIIQVNINAEDATLDNKYSNKIEQYKEETIKIDADASISEDSFKCPFTYNSSREYDFDLVLEKTSTAKIAKLRIANYLAKLDKDKDDDEQVDSDELMITINNKEVYTQEILYDKYKSASKSNPAVRFIVNKEVLDMTESNIFLATAKNVFFGSYEIF